MRRRTENSRPQGAFGSLSVGNRRRWHYQSTQIIQQSLTIRAGAAKGGALSPKELLKRPKRCGRNHPAGHVRLARGGEVPNKIRLIAYFGDKMMDATERTIATGRRRQRQLGSSSAKFSVAAADITRHRKYIRFSLSSLAIVPSLRVFCCCCCCCCFFGSVVRLFRLGRGRVSTVADNQEQLPIVRIEHGPVPVWR